MQKKEILKGFDIGNEFYAENIINLAYIMNSDEVKRKSKHLLSCSKKGYKIIQHETISITLDDCGKSYVVYLVYNGFKNKKPYYAGYLVDKDDDGNIIGYLKFDYKYDRIVTFKKIEHYQTYISSNFLSRIAEHDGFENINDALLQTVIHETANPMIIFETDNENVKISLHACHWGVLSAFIYNKERIMEIRELVFTEQFDEEYVDIIEKAKRMIDRERILLFNRIYENKIIGLKDQMCDILFK